MKATWIYERGAALILATALLITESSSHAQVLLSPAVNFTLRDNSVDGTADQVDATPDGSGFDGFLSVNSMFAKDRHFVEFDMSSLLVPNEGVILSFSTAFIGTDFGPCTLRVSSYIGDGEVNLSDWSVETSSLATIPSITVIGGQFFQLNVTPLVAGYEGAGYMGICFDLVDFEINQKALTASSIVLKRAM